jgi:hypothetical protein
MDHHYGAGFPDNLNLPSGLRIRADIGPDGELVDLSDFVEREGIVIERTNDPGASTATIPVLSEVGDQYNIYSSNKIFIDITDPEDFPDLWPTGWPNTGRYVRLFMGQTIKPDDTMLQPDEREITLQCVDNGWYEKFPPMNAALPYPPQGTPFVNTVLSGTYPVSGTDLWVTPFRMKNIYPGKWLTVADADGRHLERIEVKTVNYAGQLEIAQQIPAAGVVTVTVTDTTGIVVGQPYHVYNISDGTHFETVYPTAVSTPTGPGTFTAQFVNSHKDGPWLLMAGRFTTDLDYVHIPFVTSSATPISGFSIP